MGCKEKLESQDDESYVRGKKPKERGIEIPNLPRKAEPFWDRLDKESKDEKRKKEVEKDVSRTSRTSRRGKRE